MIVYVVDNLSKEKRSKVMTSIRGSNTKPEVVIRKMLWAAGKRYRIHDRAVFGIPDISNKRRKVAIFVDGCFWHGCEKCYKEPTTNTIFWRDKINRNRARRAAVKDNLGREGWILLEFWEHDILQDPASIISRIGRYWH